MPPVTAYIALGANMGDRAANIRAAVDKLAAVAGVLVINISSLLDNPAVGGPSDSPAFLNAAAEIETTLSPQDLLQALLGVERSLGRERREKWGPRAIDLDLLLCADQIIAEPELTVPHPLMHTRSFVLAPLAEIAPQAMHPVLHETIKTLWEKLGDQNRK